MVNWQQDTGAKRTHDLPGEMKPVKPQLAPQKTHADSTGFTSQVAGLMTDNVMERAVKDRMQQAVDEEKAQYADGADTEEVAAHEERDEDVDKDGGDTREEDDLEVLRARRREQMKKAHEKKQKYAQLGHGIYDEIAEEDFLKTVTASERCIVHFYHRNFERCKLMDMHLGKCAKQFIGTKFVKLNSEKSPFFVEKLRVKTLPCIVVFMDGVAKGRQVGFEGLNGDEFTSAQLAWRLKYASPDGHEGIEEEFGPDDDF
jgi:hypothetical protein